MQFITEGCGEQVSTMVQSLAGVRVDRSRKADRALSCLVCKGKIDKGEKFSQSGTTDDRGEIPYWVSFHPECLRLIDASVQSRAA